MTQAPNQRYREGRTVIVVGMVVNVALTIIKIVAGTLGHSQALIADGVHSLSDLFTDLVAYIGLKFSSKPADDDHPYGHGKIETFATTLVGMLLIITGIGLGLQAVRSLREGEIATPGAMALVAAVISIFSNEALYRYTMVQGRRLHSNVLVANAWHHRSDALSSLAALVGVGGARLNMPILDPLAAIVVALMIIKAGWNIVSQGARELVEEALPPEQNDTFAEIAQAVTGVRGISQLQARRVGPAVVIDISITVDGTMTVAAGHDLAHAVEDSLIASSPEIEVVNVHVEPEEMAFAPRPDSLVTNEPDAHNARSEDPQR